MIIKIIEVAKILSTAGVPLVAVDGYFEAKAIIDSTKCNVLVMGATRPENTKLLDTKRCSFVVQDVRSLGAFAKTRKKVRIHMELNTGMNRLGLSPKEIREYLDYLREHQKLQLEGVMSHLADADNPDNSFSAKQLTSFNKSVSAIIAEGWKPKYIHLAQTAGSTKVDSKYTNAIRLGIGLYGINPLEKTDPKFDELSVLQPVMSLKSTIIKVQELKKGDKVSYNGIFTAPHAMRVGILPLGYYEGYPRELSNVGTVTYRNQPLPVVGRVCMNHTMINLNGSDATVGSTITLINCEKTAPNSIANICETHGLFSYQLVTSITEKIKRIIV